MAVLDDTRADWHARRPLRPLTAVPLSTRIGVSWHWLGDGHGPNRAKPHQDCLEQVRAWQAFHQDIRGWSDLGYNALVCQHGRAIEGRGLAYAGAHSPSVNTLHWGVQFMVGDADPFPSPVMLERAVRLRAELRARAGHPLRDWPHRHDPKVNTECPGDALAGWVARGGPTTTTTQEDDMSAEDVKQVNDYTAKLLLYGYTENSEPKPSLLAVLVETQRRVSRTEAALTALATGLGPQVQEAVRQALETDYQVELTRKGAVQVQP